MPTKKKNIPIMILVQPQMGENIGAAARAMANFGLCDLRLVAPRDGWPNERAITMSSGALGQGYVDTQIFETLEAAIADCHFVLGTSARRRDMMKPVYGPRNAVEEMLERKDQKTAFVFGPERTGLTNDHLALCHGLITVPTNEEFPSINLAQSVLLMAYEYSLGTQSSDKSSLHGLSGQSMDHPYKAGDDGVSKKMPVTQEKLEEFLARLETELDSAGFFKTEGLKPTMQRSIRNIFTRNDLSDQEVRTLHGVLSALRKTEK